MKVFRKMKTGRRRSSRASSQASFNSSMSEAEFCDMSCGDERSYLNGSTTGRIVLVPQYSMDGGGDDTLTETCSLPPPYEDVNDDSSVHRNNFHTSANHSLTIVLYDHPSPPKSLPDSLHSWLQHAEALVQSREMKALLGSSCDVIKCAAVTGKDAAVSTGGVVVHVALLPIKIPFHIAATTTGWVVGVAGNVVQTVVGAAPSSGGEPTSSTSPIDGLVHNVVNAVPFLVDSAGRITQEIGTIVGRVVSPMLGINADGEKPATTAPDSRQSSPARPYSTLSGESSAERKNLFDRMRLDFQPTKEVPSEALPSPSSSVKPSSVFSKYLLRVDDIHVVVTSDPDPAAPNSSQVQKAIFIDLDEEFSDKSITNDALAKLLFRGLNFVATNPSAHMCLSGYKASSTVRIDWKPEGSTARILRQMSQAQSTSEIYRSLHRHVLVWSGIYRGPAYYGSENPLFLARGVVRRSPKDFFNMLWDSDRTGEYNNFSLGRSDVVVIDDSISSGGNSGAKVIRSETKVPFTGLTVSLSALMHAKKIKEGNTYIIVSRSLNSGLAGYHVDTSKRVEKSNKNEIHLGVNIMRPVPGHPELTDLMSLSHVSSSLVPQFLAFRIGMMGVEDFFSKVRKE